MLYKLFMYLRTIDPGFDVFRYITFRTAAATLTALFLSLVIGPVIVDILRKKTVTEKIRQEGPKSHYAKEGTPTMGGVIILAAMIIPTLLWADLEREFDWIARCGAHGVVWPVNNSEQRVLAFPERVRGLDLLAQTVGGRIPTVGGVADTSKAGAVALSEAAGKAGVDAVIALPPWGAKLHSEALIEDYFRAIADAAGVPVFVQNLLPPIGSGLSSARTGKAHRQCNTPYTVQSTIRARASCVSTTGERRPPMPWYASHAVLTAITLRPLSNNAVALLSAQHALGRKEGISPVTKAVHPPKAAPPTSVAPSRTASSRPSSMLRRPTGILK